MIHPNWDKCKYCNADGINVKGGGTKEKIGQLLGNFGSLCYNRTTIRLYNGSYGKAAYDGFIEHANTLHNFSVCMGTAACTLVGAARHPLRELGAGTGSVEHPGRTVGRGCADIGTGLLFQW